MIINNNEKRKYTRENFCNCKEKYGTEPEYLWLSSPYNAVLRHTDNKKWYAILMKVSRSKLGLSGDDTVDILDIKCDPLISGSFLWRMEFFPAIICIRETGSLFCLTELLA